MIDLRARDHVQHAVHQAEPGPENGNDGHHLAGNGFHFHGPGPAFDGPLFGLELLGGFIHEQPGDFLGQHTEFAGGGGFLPKDAQFVPHERMIIGPKEFCPLLGIAWRIAHKKN